MEIISKIEKSNNLFFQVGSGIGDVKLYQDTDNDGDGDFLLVGDGVVQTVSGLTADSFSWRDADFVDSNSLSPTYSLYIHENAETTFAGYGGYKVTHYNTNTAVTTFADLKAACQGGTCTNFKLSIPSWSSAEISSGNEVTLAIPDLDVPCLGNTWDDAAGAPFIQMGSLDFTLSSSYTYDAADYNVNVIRDDPSALASGELKPFVAREVSAITRLRTNEQYNVSKNTSHAQHNTAHHNQQREQLQN